MRVRLVHCHRCRQRVEWRHVECRRDWRTWPLLGVRLAWLSYRLQPPNFDIYIYIYRHIEIQYNRKSFMMWNALSREILAQFLALGWLHSSAASRRLATSLTICISCIIMCMSISFSIGSSISISSIIGICMIISSMSNMISSITIIILIARPARPAASPHETRSRARRPAAAAPPPMSPQDGITIIIVIITVSWLLLVVVVVVVVWLLWLWTLLFVVVVVVVIRIFASDELQRRAPPRPAACALWLMFQCA